jgi:hypothetical protein
MTESKKKKKFDVTTNLNHPTIFVDNLHIDSRTDGMHLIRLLTGLPEGHVEQAKCIISNEHLRRMLDVLCNHLKYFPKKASK